MPTLPNLTGKQLLSALSSLGFQVIRTRGSHSIETAFQPILDTSAFAYP